MVVSVAVDTSYIVAWVDFRDALHRVASDIRPHLKLPLELVYFDVVFGEAVSVLGRRANEQQRADEFPALLTTLTRLVQEGSVTWVWPYVPRLLDSALDLCTASLGKLNFNDALMVAICRELNIEHVLSFDRDFDTIPTLKRLSTPGHVQAAATEAE